MLLDRVERTEKLRDLGAPARLRYTVLLAVTVAAALLGSILLSIIIALVAFTIVYGLALTLEDVMVLSLPVIVVFLITISFTKNTTVRPGDDVRTALKKSFISGIKVGLIGGFFAGLLWSIVSRASADVIRWERWELLFTPEIITNSLVIAVGLAPGVAIFRAITGVIEDVVLVQVTGNRKKS